MPHLICQSSIIFELDWFGFLVWSFWTGFESPASFRLGGRVRKLIHHGRRLLEPHPPKMAGKFLQLSMAAVSVVSSVSANSESPTEFSHPFVSLCPTFFSWLANCILSRIIVIFDSASQCRLPIIIRWSIHHEVFLIQLITIFIFSISHWFFCSKIKCVVLSAHGVWLSALICSIHLELSSHVVELITKRKRCNYTLLMHFWNCRLLTFISFFLLKVKPIRLPNNSEDEWANRTSFSWMNKTFRPDGRAWRRHTWKDWVCPVE